MKLIIAGTRTLKPKLSMIKEALVARNIQPSQIVGGGCYGVDLAGKLFSEASYLPYVEYSAEWELYGKSAGPRRNRLMAAYADALLLIWDGISKGSKNMKEEMLKLGKPVYEIIC